MKKALIGLLLTVVGIAALVLIPSKQPPAPMPWDVTIMADGNSEVFGIHLGNSTYKEAQQQLKEFGETAIFTEEDSEPSVEAFFQSINLGGLSAKLVLKLVVEPAQIDNMLAHAMEARIQPSGARRHKLDNEANAKLINAVVSTITYIPSVRLNEEMIRYRFGDPQTISKDEEEPTTDIWHYPSSGLIIRLNEKQKTILEYQAKTLAIVD